ncbi:MAG: carboxypeptidase regulatory-like domain-containing protein [Acidobacteriota bacterium]
MLTGRVTEASSGEGVPSALVSLYNSSGVFSRFTSTNASGFYTIQPPEPGFYTALADGPDSLLPVLSGGSVCPGGIPTGCAPTDGVPFELSAGETTLDFALPAAGEVSGRILVPEGLDLFTSASVNLFRADGSLRASRFVGGEDLTFSVPGLEAGTYFAVAEFNDAFFGELWQDISCLEPDGSCDPMTGTPIVVQRGVTLADVDFTARLRGLISGTVRSRSTGEPLSPAIVQVFDSEGFSVSRARLLPNGEFRAVGLDAGTYFLGTIQTFGFIDQILGGELCEPGPCDPTSGLAIAVSEGMESGPFEILLEPGPGFQVEARSQSGQPIRGAAIDLWRSTGDFLRSVTTDAGGRVEIPLDEGFYFLSTDNGQGLIDQIWSGVSCPAGPASLDLCDILSGDLLELIEGQLLTEISFELEDPSILFSDSFESGGLGAWSAVTGGP